MLRPASITMTEVISLKESLSARFGAKLHLHDACGAMSFSLSSSTPDLTRFIEDYLRAKSLTPLFSPDNLSFTIAKET